MRPGTSGTATLSVGPAALPAGRRQAAYRLGSTSRRTEVVVGQGQAVAFRRQSLTEILQEVFPGRLSPADLEVMEQMIAEYRRARGDSGSSQNEVK